MGYVTNSVRVSSVNTASTVSDTGFVLSSGSNRKVIVMASHEDDASNGNGCTGVTFNSTSMSRSCPTSANLTIDGTRREMSVWYIDEASLPSSGTYTITATYSGTIETLGMIALELADMASGAGINPLTAINGNLTLSVEITPTIDESTILVFGFNISQDSTATQESSDYTSTELVDAGYPSIAQCRHTAAYGVLGTAGTVTAGLTWSAGVSNGMCVVAFSPTSTIEYLDPTGQVANSPAWNSPIGDFIQTNLHTMLDDGVRQPTDPSATSDEIWTGNASVLTLSFPEPSGPVSKVTVWAFCGIPSGTDTHLQVDICRDGSTWVGYGSLGTISSSPAWKSCTFSSLGWDTPTDFQVRIRTTNDFNDPTIVEALYVEVTVSSEEETVPYVVAYATRNLFGLRT